jgi:hypothetical protein
VNGEQLSIIIRRMTSITGWAYPRILCRKPTYSAEPTPISKTYRLEALMTIISFRFLQKGRAFHTCVPLYLLAGVLPQRAREAHNSQHRLTQKDRWGHFGKFIYYSNKLRLRPGRTVRFRIFVFHFAFFAGFYTAWFFPYFVVNP